MPDNPNVQQYESIKLSLWCRYCGWKIIKGTLKQHWDDEHPGWEEE